MNTEYYKVFLKVLETGNISKAAQQLGYTQSGVSHIISKLETQLELTLLYRERSGISITEQAKPLVPLMKSVLESERLIFKTAAEERESFLIRLVTIHSIAISWLPQMLSDFQTMLPAVRFEIIEKSKYPEIEDLIINGDVHCGFSVETNNPRIRFTPVFQDDYCVILPQKHPLTALKNISPDELKGYPFLLPEEGVTNKSLEDIIKQLNIKQDLTTNTLDDLMTLSLVEQGWGISIVPRLVADVSKSHVVIRTLDGPYYRTIAFALSEGSKATPVLKSFLDFIPQWISQHINSGMKK
ncbi:LysR family transcriptional regulator [Anaerovorax odorimutans]|uniref:LysR family transcriptional regulator n=1 Tax=Anaerovorax odorimutans TaxID=109327 RepID=A0ABT1RRZ3_9FIRM|nr:LysR family transcriptional regulator [Anaerovorax odorimutans]MCQ4637930.1 LysR family transcriptional regulator [Anaerovorax odorimutans]